MDAEQRHELKTNELAASLVKLKDWADKYGNTILTVIAVAALAFAGYRWWSWRHESAMQAAWEKVRSANVGDKTAGEAPLDTLRSVIADAPGPTVAAMARLRLAAGLLDRAEDAGGETRLSEAARELESITASSLDDSLKGAAWIKLATVYETRRDFKAAREAYQHLIDTPAFADLPFKKVAEDRLKNFDDVATKVVFLPGSPPPPPPPATAPTASATSAPSAETANPATTQPAAATPASENPDGPQWKTIKLDGPINEHPLFAQRDPSASQPASQPASAPAGEGGEEGAPIDKEKKEDKP